MTLILGIACAVLFLGAMGMAAKIKALETKAAEATEAVFERARIKERVRDLLVPLGWSWAEVAGGGLDATEDRLRLYLVAAYTEIQKALQADDLEMAEAVEAATLQEPPRRMPRYPQVPAFLARPEDAVSMPRGSAFEDYIGPALDHVDPAADLHSFTCTDGHRTTTHQSVDLTGEPCQVPSEEDEGQPCRKVLR